MNVQEKAVYIETKSDMFNSVQNIMCEYGAQKCDMKNICETAPN